MVHSEDIKYYDTGNGWTQATASAWDNYVNATIGGIGVLIAPGVYRILHSYKLLWAVCHLFPQRWRTLNVQSRETIGQEDHVICLQLRRRV